MTGQDAVKASAMCYWRTFCTSNMRLMCDFQFIITWVTTMPRVPSNRWAVTCRSVFSGCKLRLWLLRRHKCHFYAPLIYSCGLWKCELCRPEPSPPRGPVHSEATEQELEQTFCLSRWAAAVGEDFVCVSPPPVRPWLLHCVALPPSYSAVLLEQHRLYKPNEPWISLVMDVRSDSWLGVTPSLLSSSSPLVNA